jgi:hypothetical protein
VIFCSRVKVNIALLYSLFSSVGADERFSACCCFATWTKSQRFVEEG